MHQVESECSVLDGAAVFVAIELSKSAWLLAAQASPSRGEVAEIPRAMLEQLVLAACHAA